MSIEEATEILNNAVITEPSIKSYTYKCRRNKLSNSKTNNGIRGKTTRN